MDVFYVSRDLIADILQEAWDRQSLPARSIELRCVADDKGTGHYAYYAVSNINGVEATRWLGVSCEQALDSIADIAHQHSRRPS